MLFIEWSYQFIFLLRPFCWNFNFPLFLPCCHLILSIGVSSTYSWSFSGLFWLQVRLHLLVLLFFLQPSYLTCQNNNEDYSFWWNIFKRTKATQWLLYCYVILYICWSSALSKSLSRESFLMSIKESGVVCLLIQKFQICFSFQRHFILNFIVKLPCLDFFGIHQLT